MKFNVWLVAVVLLGIATACEELVEIKPVDDDNGDVKGDTLVASPDEPDDEKSDNAVQYTIEEGHHYPNKNYFALSEISELNFRARFDSTAIYETKKASNQADINKLYGFSDCSDFHHKNSARFGWRWYHDQLEILGYVYANSKREWKLVGTVPFDAYNTYSIKVEDDKYIFSLNDVSVELPRHCSDEKATGYMLYPYFGGDEHAPGDINIFIEDL